MLLKHICNKFTKIISCGMRARCVATSGTHPTNGTLQHNDGSTVNMLFLLFQLRKQTRLSRETLQSAVLINLICDPHLLFSVLSDLTLKKRPMKAPTDDDSCFKGKKNSEHLSSLCHVRRRLPSIPSRVSQAESGFDDLISHH